MTSWSQVRLEELITDASYGTSVKCSESEGGIPVLRMGNVRYDGNLDLDDLKYATLTDVEMVRFGLRTGDLLFNRTNSKELVGKTGLWDGRFPAAAASYFIRVRVKQDVVMPEWIWWFMNSPFMKRRLFETARGAIGQANINGEELKAFPVPLPPLDEQRRIVDILNHAASIRRLREEAWAKAREIIPALFVEMFGNPATNPKGWPIKKLSELGSLERGKSKHRPRNDPALFGGGYPFIQTGDVANSGGIIRHFSDTYSEFGLAQSKLWPAGTLCITIAANIAKTGILAFDACFPDSVVGFIPFPQATTRYVQYFLHFLQPYLEKSAPQLAQKNINLEILREISIPAPPLPLQQEFAERVAEIEGISALNDRAVTLAEQMTQSLLDRVFGGGNPPSGKEADHPSD